MTEDIFETLMKEGELCADILLNTDFEALLDMLLELISSMITQDKIVIENKLIVENSLNLVIGILIKHPKLLNKFINYKCQAIPEIQTGKDFVLYGLLYNTEDKIRNDF